MSIHLFPSFSFFFFNDPATTEIYTLSLHDALPISRLSSNVTVAVYTPGSRFKASRAVAGQLPHVILEMCSRTVAVSAACRATGVGCAPAVWSPASHNGQRTAAPPTPAAKSSVSFNDDNMV